MEDTLSLKHWGTPPKNGMGTVGKCVAVHCGWGRVLFGQTFDKPELLAGRLMEEETGLPVLIAEDPLTCVARGGGRALDMLDERGGELLFALE